MNQKRTGGARARYSKRRRAMAIRALKQPRVTVQAAQADPAVVAQLAQLEQSVQAASEENNQLRQAVSRQRAEFDNFRRRVVKEKEQIRETAHEELIAKLLPVLDNLERALASIDKAVDPKSIREGITMVSSQLSRLLESHGLERIEAMGAQFDPQQHEALATEERADVPENHVSEEMLPGYRYRDKVIRAAMVKVAKAPAEKTGT